MYRDVQGLCSSMFSYCWCQQVHTSSVLDSCGVFDFNHFVANPVVFPKKNGCSYPDQPFCTRKWWGGICQFDVCERPTPSWGPVDLWIWPSCDLLCDAKGLVGQASDLEEEPDVGCLPFHFGQVWIAAGTPKDPEEFVQFHAGLSLRLLGKSQESTWAGTIGVCHSVKQYFDDSWI